MSILGSVPWAFWIALWLMLNVIAVGIYDLFAYFFLPANESVSFWCQSWLVAFPVLGIALGIVLGHLAWPLKVVVQVTEKGGAQFP